MLRSLVLCSAASLAFATGAMGADLPDTKGPPAFTPPPPAFSWTGFYVGVNVGYGIGDDPTTESTVSGAAFPIIPPGTPIYGTPRSFTIAPQGVVGGAQIGFNYQFTPNVVAGLEADFQGSGMSNTQNCLLPCGTPIDTVATSPILRLFPVSFSQISEEHQIDWFGTVRGRLGYAVGPVLIYGTGGLAYGDVVRSGNVAGRTTFVFTGATVDTFAGSYSASSTNIGWTAGGGIEGKLTNNWSVKAEYLYVDLGSTTDTFSTFFTSGVPASGQAGVRTDVASFHENIFRVGLNYQFGLFEPPGAVVAKY